MGKQIRVYPSPEAFRTSAWSVERIHAEVTTSLLTGQPLMPNFSMGAGKTRGLIEYIKSGLWRSICAAVVLFYYTHRQMSEVERQLTGAGLMVRRYPPRDPDRCAENDEAMRFYETMKLPTLAKIEVCSRCPARDGCPYLERSEPEWAEGADVILAPEQILPVFPTVLDRWSMNIAGGVRGSRKPLLVVFDEVKVADTGFYSTFTSGDLVQEMRAAEAGTFYDIADFLAALQKHPSTPAMWTRPTLESDDLVRLQRIGIRLFDKKYRPVLEQALHYAADPVWHERGIYCIANFPQLPATTMFLGAFLSAEYLARRCGVPVPRALVDGDLVLHPSSKVINIPSGLGIMKHWPNNRAAIINFVADVIAANHAAGKTTVVVGRKDDVVHQRATEATTFLLAALAKRGLAQVKVVLAVDELLPMEPSRDLVPYLTYGAIGLNALEGYDTILFLHGFYVPESAISDIVFAELPPSRRPRFQVRIRGGRRHIDWTDTVSAEVQRYAQAVLFRLEADVALQAFGRVRYTIHPRVVVMSVLHNVLPHVGRISAVRNLTEARAILGLGRTVDQQHGGQTERLRAALDQGQTLKDAAGGLGISYASAKRLAAAADIQPGPGRKAKGLKSTLSNTTRVLLSPFLTTDSAIHPDRSKPAQSLSGDEPLGVAL